MITYWGTPSESSVSLSRTHVHAHTISFTCGMALLYFEGLVRGPLGNALTILQRGRRTDKQIWHCRARGDACGQVSQAWRTAASTDSRDRQGPAGTRSCGWSPLRLVTASVGPGKTTEENAYSAYSAAPSSLLPPVFSCSLPHTLPSGGL